MHHRLIQDMELVAFIGLDWADQSHAVCLQEAASSQVEHCQIKQTPEALAQWVSDLQQRFPGRKVAVALEQSRGPVIHALMHYDFLVLYRVNPQMLCKYRKAFANSGAKSDSVDAALLLELLRRHRDKLKAWVADDVQTRTLQLLVEGRRKLVNERTRLSNRLTSTLKGYYPQALQWAGSLTSKQLRLPAAMADACARAKSQTRDHRKVLQGTRQPAGRGDRAASQ